MSANKVDQLIFRIMEKTGISSQAELADALGINRSGITHARHKNQVPDKWVLKLYRKFGFSPRWIETGVGSMFSEGHETEESITSIPVVEARLSAGTGSFDVGEGVIGHLAFQSSWLSKKGSSAGMVAMEVFGQSMEPVIREGDTVLIDQSRKEIIAGAIYAVGVEDTILVKRLEKHPDKLVLCSDNRDYQPIYLEKDDAQKVRIIGKIIWSCREYR